MPKKILPLSAQFLLTLSCSILAVSAKYCEKDSDCDLNIGEVCWWEWKGCKRGECMCDPRESLYDPSKRKCQSWKYGDEKCEEGDRCRDGMSCKEGFCKCNQGTLTDDKTFCLRDHEKLLDQKCTQDDICYQKAVQEYTRRDVHCNSGGRCQCNHGYKEQGITCSKLKVNEAGCRRDFHCQGGALCNDGVCRCPSGYMTVARATKCARGGAFYINIKLGESCDEIQEQAYCAHGLECRECPKDNFYTCARYILPYHMNSATNEGSMVFTLFASLVTSTITILLHCH